MEERSWLRTSVEVLRLLLSVSLRTSNWTFRRRCIRRLRHADDGIGGGGGGGGGRGGGRGNEGVEDRNSCHEWSIGSVCSMSRHRYAIDVPQSMATNAIIALPIHRVGGGRGADGGGPQFRDAVYLCIGPVKMYSFDSDSLYWISFYSHVFMASYCESIMKYNYMFDVFFVEF